MFLREMQNALHRKFIETIFLFTQELLRIHSNRKLQFCKSNEEYKLYKIHCTCMEIMRNQKNISMMIHLFEMLLIKIRKV